MGADGVIIFYGIRYEVTDESEVQQLETQKHPLVQAAEQAGLQSYWGNFSVEGGEFYLLYVGRNIASIGYEGLSELELRDEQLATIQIETRERLTRGGFSLVPAFFAQFEPDF